jgi:flagellar M-ring protein FliF
MAANYFQRLRSDSTKFLSQLSLSQKIGLGTVSVISIIALIALFMWAQQPNWSILYAELGSKDASLMVDLIKEKQIPYQLRSQTHGTQIMVPSQFVHDLRLEMAGQDLPKEGGVVGFELFDKDTMGITSNMFDLNYQRALAGELARTIMQIEGVERARVHLAIPKKQLFTQLEEPPTASVTLKLKPDSTLNLEQFKGISKLVANSVPGLQQKNVSVTDTQGNLLFDSDTLDAENGAEATKVNGQRLEYQRTLEKRIRQDVEKILIPVVGLGNVTVQAKADLDFDKQETVSKSYTSTTGNKPDAVQAVRSEKESTETGQGTQTAPGGAPGVSSNIPTYQETSGESDSNYARKEVVRNYEVPEVQTKVIKSSGQLKRLTLSVAINSLAPALSGETGTVRPDDPIMRNLRELAVAAAGINTDRGDTIALHAVPFDDSGTREEQDALEKAASRDLIQNMLVSGVAGLGILALLTAVYLAFGRRRPPTEGELLDMEARSLGTGQTEAPALDEEEEPLGLEPGGRKNQAVKGLTQMTIDDSARVARLLRLLMSENNQG